MLMAFPSLLFFPLLASPLPLRWSPSLLDSLYSTQELYTDSQYGKDFGYYSTGRIISDLNDDFFNSYTTFPLSLSPHFGAMIGFRLRSMWLALERPKNFFIFEFGAGTGRLAFDILEYLRENDAEMYKHLKKYAIGERSVSLHKKQKSTLEPFKEKAFFLNVDARSEGSKIRQELWRELRKEEGGGGEEGGGEEVVGIVVSNELVDEFDPARVHFSWSLGEPPSEEGVRRCEVWKESFVLHSVDEETVREAAGNADPLSIIRIFGPSLKRQTRREGVGGFEPASAESLEEVDGTSPERTARRLVKDWLDSVNEETEDMPCRLLRGLDLGGIGEGGEGKRNWCLALVMALKDFAISREELSNNYEGEILEGRLPIRPLLSPSEFEQLNNTYLTTLELSKDSLFLTKERYREFRGLLGFQTSSEQNVLLSSAEISQWEEWRGLQARELFLRMPRARCRQMRGWLHRHGRRLSHMAHVYDSLGSSLHLTPLEPGIKLGLSTLYRPGDEMYIRQVADLLDSGFVLTVDYGSDHEALLWQAMVDPRHTGLMVFSRYRQCRNDDFGEHKSPNFLKCLGLQDITTLVDFTELAEVGKDLGLEPLFYGPQFSLEARFDSRLQEPLKPMLPSALGREGDPIGNSEGYIAWYRSHSWASFKVLIQGKGEAALAWRLSGALSWPLSRLGEERRPRLTRDPSLPPLAAWIMNRLPQFEFGLMHIIPQLIAALQMDVGSHILGGTYEVEMLREEHRNRIEFFHAHLGLLYTDAWFEADWHILVKRPDLNATHCRCPSTRENHAMVLAAATARRSMELRGQLSIHSDVMTEEIMDRILNANAFNTSITVRPSWSAKPLPLSVLQAGIAFRQYCGGEQPFRP